MKQKIDKIIAVGGFGLLGYYLGLSIFRSYILKLLQQVLPHISYIHLPTFYTAFFGIALAAPLGYLAYTLFLQKHPIAKYKKQYIIGAVFLVALPLLVAASFRVHTISIVKQAESTTPTEANIQFNNKISFWHSDSSGITYRKSARLFMDNDTLTEIGSAVNQLKFKYVLLNNNPSLNDVMFIRYSTNGKRYTKILDYNNKSFQEDLGFQKYAVYEGSALESIMQKLIIDAKDIKQYTQGFMINSIWMSEREDGKKLLSQEQYQELISLVTSKNKMTPNIDTIEYFNKLHNEGISKNNQDIYCIYLTNENASTVKFENIMVYSKKLGVLCFEGEYYKVDLSSIIAMVL